MKIGDLIKINFNNYSKIGRIEDSYMGAECRMRQIRFDDGIGYYKESELRELNNYEYLKHCNRDEIINKLYQIVEFCGGAEEDKLKLLIDAVLEEA